MKVSTLQLFLRSLRPAVTAAGGNSTLPADLEAVSAGLEPFAALDFSHFAAFLRQAEQYRSSGAVSVPTAASLGTERVQATLRSAASLADKVSRAENVAEQQFAAEREKVRQELEAAFATFLKPLAIDVTLKDDKKGFTNALNSAKTKAIIARVRAALDGVTDEASLNEPQRQQRLHVVVNHLTLADLQAAAKEIGFDTKSKTQDVVVSGIVERITGLRPTPSKATPKARQQAIDLAVVQQQAVKLKGLLEKSMDPGGLTSTELEAAINELEARNPAELQAIAKEVGLEKVGKAKKGILNQIRAKLGEADRARESIQV